MFKLFRYLRPYIFYALMAPLCMVGEVVMDLMQPKMMSKIVDEGVLGQDMQLIVTTGIKMLIMLIIGGICGIAASGFSGVASQSFSRDLRVDVFSKVMGLSFQQTDKFTTGSLVTRLTTDITAIQQVLDFCQRMLVRDVLMFVGGIVMMLGLNVKFGLVIVCALPIEIVFMAIVLKKVDPYYTVVAQRLDTVNSVVQENVTGARVVKAYVREPYEEERFTKANTDLMQANLKVANMIAVLQPVLSLIMNASIVAVIYIGGLQARAAQIMPGEIMAAITYLTRVFMGVMMMSMMFQTVSRAMASVRRINEVLDTAPAVLDGEDEFNSTEKGTVSFRNVSFSYPDAQGRPVLSQLSLDIKQGENIAILGATGSGKSSLVNLIPRFYDAVEGEVLVDGVNVKDVSLHDLREKIGIVLQKSELFSGTVEENIRWGKNDAELDEIVKAAEIAQADEFVSRMPDTYNSLIAEKGASLSGGQKQRLSISRAVLKRPEIIIFDDSTSALDLGTESRLQKALRENLAGTTLITIAQRIASVKSCDRIAVLDHGRLVGCDNHENLLKTCEVYREIYNSQVKTSGGEV